MNVKQATKRKRKAKALAFESDQMSIFDLNMKVIAIAPLAITKIAESDRTLVEKELPGCEVVVEMSTTDLLSSYASAIRRTTLLTRSEEQQLGRAIVAGRKAKKALEGLPAGDVSVTDDEILRLKQEVARGQEAGNRLVESNLRLAVSIASKYQGNGISFMDLIQEGNLGLVEAVNRFDWAKGTAFSTYAIWWVRNRVTKAIAGQGRAFRIPTGLNNKLNKFVMAVRRLGDELSRDPSPEEISARTGLSMVKVNQYLTWTTKAASLDAVISEDSKMTLGDTLSTDATRAELDEKFRKESLIGILREKLQPIEFQVLCLRYGLDGEASATLEETGKRINFSKARTQQLEAQALDKLRDLPMSVFTDLL